MLDDLQNSAAHALPPRRDDEPAGLRQEILDELTDHFACAYRRELLRTRGNKDLSRRNVLSRFGDPAHIARKLYFDAMKGKLMAQKLMVLFTCCCAVLMAVVAFMGWRLVESNQKAQAAFIAQSQEMQAAILAKLEAQPESSEPAWKGSLEWSEFELKFVEAETGKAATGVKVRVSILDGGWSTLYANLRPNEQGTISLAPLRIGQYKLSFQMPWGASAIDQIRVRPGHDFHQTYRVPTKPETGKVELNIEWPQRLQGRDLWVIVGLWQDNSREAGGLYWQSSAPRFFAIHTDGRVVDLGKFYQKQGESYVRGLGGGRRVSDYIAMAARNADGYFEPGLDEVPKGTWAPQMLGIYLKPTLPEDLSVFIRDPVWVEIDEEDVKRAAEARRFGTTARDMKVHFIGWTVGANGELIRTNQIHSYPGPGKLTVTPHTVNPWTITIPKEMAEAIPEDMLPPRTPVVAPKIPSSGGETAAMKAPATVTIRCVDHSKNARPIVGVMVTLQRYSSDPFDDDYEMPPTNADGICRVGAVEPGTYRIAIELPSGDIDLTDEFQIAANEKLERTIVCPAPWPRKPVTVDINWPTIAKNRRDLWLVMEVKEKLVRYTRELGDWSNYGRYIFAINPDGRTVAWKPDSANSGKTLFEIVQWPMSDEVKYYSSMARKHDDRIWSHSVSETPQVEMYPYYSSTHRVIGVGISRWDGSGSPDEILRNLRDGRYLAGTLGGRAEYSTRGAFFQIFRKLVPMQSSEGLPILEIRPSANPYSSPEKSEATPTLYYTVPEPLVAAALRRWEGLAVAGN